MKKIQSAGGLFLASALLFAFVSVATAGQARNTNVYFGDTHLHTSYSGDAYLRNNKTADPDTAYRFAKGLPVVHPSTRAKVSIDTPLDFLVVADHAEYVGVINKLFENDPLIVNTETGKRWKAMAEAGKHRAVFGEAVSTLIKNKPIADLDTPEVRSTIWSEIIAAAEEHNEPGKFTSFIGWEWTSMPNGANLHRVVFTRDGADIANKFYPFTSFDSDRPEDLWNWLETTSAATGANFVAIPHNSNISKGKMFALQDSDGKPITAQYAQTRMRWEPIAEITQMKGDSETHPALSPEDEFADFETYTKIIDPKWDGDYVAEKGSFVRSALRSGLEVEEKVGINPFKLGVIGSTDSHSGLSSVEEDNFYGKFGLDATPESKMRKMGPHSIGYDISTAGLAAVWAEENTREAIFDAFRRKEVYATTGPRIPVRFFGGWNYQPEDAYASNLAQIGYHKGVPMGGDLFQAPEGAAPSFLIHAVKAPKGANLDRVQLVKGWIGKDGKSREKVFNVALSDGRQEKGGKVEPVGNTVDLKTALYSNSIGDAQLSTVWSDPEFDPAQRAFYYVRVLQIPTPRNSLYDAVAMKQNPVEGYPTTIQERVYTSPIWYTPKQ